MGELKPCTFCNEMLQIKGYLAGILAGVSSANNEDLLIQYPESTENINLSPGETFNKAIEVNRKLKYLCVSVPSGCILEIKSDNITKMWFCDEAGTIEFQSGMSFGRMEINVQNCTTEAVRWTCRMLFV
ncbi:hypothetical protein Mpet_2321 [Methanolacinia petrolearia DSM 11571]|uniref:Uncharacterized protein n=1 Tax=Methanolacinia petrolearia (strain DSM 11571 / OCM 486 / SEBR 4847) TaxID=679926 RepID=E1RD85_METP4|nr:hypothetical protein [Methanolacinia petrolearia]ADN37068.1 hypothetical protein Mpet_2321 [Methanolacinia petrolearia DSM 11571]